VVTDRSSAETESLSVVKPDNLLGSYFYFRNKALKNYFDKIGYIPSNFMLDSGAYSAWSTGKNISLLDYMGYIERNKEYISYYIALDILGDPDITYDYYRIMRKKGFTPIPVFHYGADESYLQLYSKENEYIALGATVPVKDKRRVARWIIKLQYKYPQLEFHLLGSSSQAITMWTDIKSCDSSTWIRHAINGMPRHIKGNSREKKIERAIYNLEYITYRRQVKQLRLCI